MTQRLFLALWPDDEVRAALAAACSELRINSGRVIPPRNLHATLVFLGGVDAGKRECVERAAASVRGSSFELILTGTEWRRRGGMVWLAAAEVPAALQHLVAEINAALVPCGHAPEPREYKLHVTVARNASKVRRQDRFSPIRWRVTDFCLVSSALTPAGSEYSVERRWALS